MSETAGNGETAYLFPCLDPVAKVKATLLQPQSTGVVTSPSGKMLKPEIWSSAPHLKRRR